MHSMPASAAWRAAESGATRAKSSALVLAPSKWPPARSHLSKKLRMSVTRPRHAVHRHRARAAHADAARIAICQCWIQLPLDMRDDIEHRLARKARHVVA